MSEEIKRRPGRPSGRTFKPYTVNLDEDLAEWAREQPEGISGVLRLALQSIKERRDAGKTHNTKLWLLIPNQDPEHEGEMVKPFRHRADCMSFGFVVSADTEESARFIAGAHAGEETGAPWLDPEKTTAFRLHDGEPQDFILGSYADNEGVAY